MLIQLQRVRGDGVVMAHHDLVTSDHREYDDARRRMEIDLREGETIRGVSGCSGHYIKPHFPDPEDLQ